MRFLIAIIVILVVVDGYFYDWRYSRLVRDEALVLIDKGRDAIGGERDKRASTK